MPGFPQPPLGRKLARCPPGPAPGHRGGTQERAMQHVLVDDDDELGVEDGWGGMVAHPLGPPR